MKTEITEQQYRLDTVKWLVVALLTLTAMGADYYTTFSTPIKLIGWIVWFVLTTVVVITTSKGNEWLEFAKASQQELRKVVWPSRQETVQMTLTIMVVVFIVSLLLWVVDYSLLWLVGKLTQLR